MVFYTYTGIPLKPAFFFYIGISAVVWASPLLEKLPQRPILHGSWSLRVLFGLRKVARNHRPVTLYTCFSNRPHPLSHNTGYIGLAWRRLRFQPLVTEVLGVLDRLKRVVTGSNSSFLSSGYFCASLRYRKRWTKQQGSWIAWNVWSRVRIPRFCRLDPFARLWGTKKEGRSNKGCNLKFDVILTVHLR